MESLRLAYFEENEKTLFPLRETIDRSWRGGGDGGQRREPALEHSVLFIIHENRAVAAFSRL